MFTTDRLHLRGFESEDTRRVFDLWNSPSVQPTISNEYIVPRGPKFMEKVAATAEEAVMFLIIETRKGNKEGDEGGGKFVGTTSIVMSHPKNRDGIFGIMLDSGFWGRGYGEEVTRFVVDYCFQSLGLHRVSLGVYDGNERAKNLYQRVGFVEEGRKRQLNWIDGHWEDYISMGILLEEWEEKRGAKKGRE